MRFETMEHNINNEDFYQYSPLQPGQFRLLRFLETENGLFGDLKTFILGDEGSPPYKALSYVWSLDGKEPRSTTSISVADKKLPVLDSLQPFFDMLRTKKNPADNVWWWIDSISIDQRNNSEKNVQVELMQSIYQHAEETIVWLGEKSDDSNAAMELVSFLSAQKSDETLHKSELASTIYSNWTKMRNLLLRPWWTRIWTIQEYAVSNNVSVWCGDKVVSRIQMEDALSVVQKYGEKDQHNSTAFINGWHRRRVHYWYHMAPRPNFPASISLVALAVYFSSNGATDKRDRLYGLRGLVTDSDLITVNYELDPDELYLKFAQSFITRHQSLDIVCASHIFHSNGDSKLPSWVPDWGMQQSLIVISLMVNQSASTLIGNLRPPSSIKPSGSMMVYRASGEAQPVVHFHNKRLIVRGKIIDTVDGLAGTEKVGLTQTISHSNLTQGVNQQSLAYLQIICRCLVLGRGDRYLQQDMPQRFIEEFWTLCFKTMTGDDAMIDHSFKDWLIQNMSLNINGYTLGTILGNLVDDRELKKVSNQLDYSALNVFSFMGRFYDTVIRMSRRLMIGESGVLGMAPDAAEKGDTVCILYGCSVPVVLRKVAGEESYTFIGECFLDEYMSGEAVQDLRFLEQTFSII